MVSRYGMCGPQSGGPRLSALGLSAQRQRQQPGGLAQASGFTPTSTPQLSTGLSMPPPMHGGATPFRPGMGIPPKGGPVLQVPPSPGIRPPMGGLAAYTGAGGPSGPISGPQQPPMGRSRFMGRVPGAQPGNGLLRTAGGAYRDPGDRLSGMMNRFRPTGMYAKGGRVKKAVAALHEARNWLIHSSDEPEFDMARAELDQVPGAEGLKERLREIQKIWRTTDLSEDEAMGLGREMDDEFERFRSAMDPDSPSFQEQDLTFMDEPTRRPENERLRGSKVQGIKQEIEADSNLIDDRGQYSLQDWMEMYGISSDEARDLQGWIHQGDPRYKPF